MNSFQWAFRNRRVRTVGRLLAGAALLAGVAGMAQYQAGRPVTAPPPPKAPVYDLTSQWDYLLGATDTKKHTAEELRKRYPFESLTRRLEYESARTKASERPVPELSADASKRLEAMEGGNSLRAESLKQLHSDQVERFIAREGFGVSRMPMPSPEFLELPSAPPIPFTASGARVVPPPPGPAVALARGDGPRVAGPDGTDLRMPSLLQLDAFHFAGQNDFVSRYSLGYLKDRDHVAGFQSHQFRAMPEVGPLPVRGQPPPREKWAISRLELVSLLKQERPAVYVSEELPRMERLKKAKTRPLDEFESAALARLQKGEDVVAEASVNRIRMMGSLRAAKQCLDCHSVRRGELLGSFSYDLQRVPPHDPAR
jgi:hypothetical protein